MENKSFNIGSYFYDKLKTKNNLNESYEYAFQYFFFGIFSQLMWMISGLILSILLKCQTEYIYSCLAFCLLRRLSGGMHLDEHSKCYYTTVFMMTLFGFISMILINYYIILFLISIGSIIYIVWCVPKKSENTAEYTVEEETIFRKRYCKTALLLYVINLVLIYLINNQDILSIINNILNYILNIVGLKFIITEYLLTQIISSLSIGMTASVLMLTNWFEWLLIGFWKLFEKNDNIDTK